MKSSNITFGKIFILFLFLISLFLVFSGPLSISAYAAPSPCITDWETSPDLGDYLDCAIPKIFSAFRTILVGLAIIFTILLTYRMMTNTTNSKVMEEIPTRWLYLIIFVILIVGGGTALNIILKFFGFGDVETWIKLVNDVIDAL